jgi:hypothetical protein
MRLWGYQLTEHDPTKPWIVLGSEHRTIELPEERAFFEWANEAWPRDRYTVTLDPGQLSPWGLSASH